MMMLDIPDPVLLAAKISTAVHPLLVIYNYMLNKQLYQKNDSNTTGSIKKTVSWLNETFFLNQVLKNRRDGLIMHDR